MKKIDIEKTRKHEIFKSNSIIQKGRHRYTNRQQKEILYICSMLNPNLKKQEYIFDINEFAQVCGIENNGRIYEEIRDDLAYLKSKCWIIPINDEIGEGEAVVSFLSQSITYRKTGKVKIAIDEWVYPEMLEVKEKFTKYELYNILALSGEHAISLYEQFKSRQNLGQWIVEREELKNLLMINELKHYEKWYEVKRKIIEPALKQINKYTDLNVVYKDNGRRGVKATKICFVINFKEPIERAYTKASVDLILNSNSKSISREDEIDFGSFIKNNKTKYSVPKKEKKS